MQRNALGWYRKHFYIPAEDSNKIISVEFDGVFRDCILWINEHYIGRHTSDYTGFRYDISDYIRYGSDNVLTLRVDISQVEGWFYEGGGIYRHVWLTKTGKLYIIDESLFIPKIFYFLFFLIKVFLY